MASAVSQSPSSSSSQGSIAVALDPEMSCRAHFPAKVIDLLTPILGYNMRHWTVLEGNIREKWIPFVEDGINLALCREKGELDIYITMTHNSRDSSAISTSRFSYKDGVPTTHVNINPANQGTDAQKIEEGFLALQKAIQEYQDKAQRSL